MRRRRLTDGQLENSKAVAHWNSEQNVMWYAIFGQDIPDSLDRRKAARPAHLARLQTLQDEGRLLLAGPFPAVESDDPGIAGFTGSLIVAEFPSLQAAQAWADADPYVSAGVYQNKAVRPFKKVFPA